MPTTDGVGRLIRDWRRRRRRSQMDLALDVGVSPRHLSFVETGRSKPSPELLLGLAEVLDVPLRERNAFLLAAGYAPRYQQTSLEDPAMARVRTAVQRLLASHDPYPGVAIDRLWNVVLANAADRGRPGRLARGGQARGAHAARPLAAAAGRCRAVAVHHPDHLRHAPGHHPGRAGGGVV